MNTPAIKLTETVDFHKFDTHDERVRKQIDALDRLVSRLLDAEREDLIVGIVFNIHESMLTGGEEGTFIAREDARDRSEWADYALHRMVKLGVRSHTNAQLLKIIEREPKGDELKELDPHGKLLMVAIHETQRRQAIAFLKTS